MMAILKAVEERQGAESRCHVVLDALQELDEGGALAWVLLPAQAHQLMAAERGHLLGLGGSSPQQHF